MKLIHFVTNACLYHDPSIKSGSFQLKSKVIGGTSPPRNINCHAYVRGINDSILCSATLLSLEYLLCPAHCCKNAKDNHYGGMNVLASRKRREVRYLHIHKNYKYKNENEAPTYNIGFIAVSHFRNCHLHIL